jgi:hypothetical protein
MIKYLQKLEMKHAILKKTNVSQFNYYLRIRMTYAMLKRKSLPFNITFTLVPLLLDF